VGIHNINVLTDPDTSTRSGRKLQQYIEAKRIVEHRGGRHPFGQKRRDCPLCQAGK
jgi:hypothetical protein